MEAAELRRRAQPKLDDSISSCADAVVETFVLLLSIKRDLDAVGTTAGNAATSQHPFGWHHAPDSRDDDGSRPTRNSVVVTVRTAYQKVNETNFVQQPANTLPDIFPWCLSTCDFRCLFIA